MLGAAGTFIICGSVGSAEEAAAAGDFLVFFFAFVDASAGLSGWSFSSFSMVPLPQAAMITYK